MAEIFVLTLLFSAVAALQFASLASANPVPYPPAPNTELPALTVQVPPNYSDGYATNTLSLNFAVTKPDSWNAYWLGATKGLPIIGDYWVLVYLDGVLNCMYYDPRVRDVPTANYSVVLDGLTSETHILKMQVRARAFYNNTNYSYYQTLQYNEYHSNVTQTSHFTLNADSKTIVFTADPQVVTREPYSSQSSAPSPSPSPSPSASPNPSPSSSPQETETEPEPFTVALATTAAVAVVVIGLGLLVYFNKRKA